MKIPAFILAITLMCSCQSKVSDKSVVPDPGNNPDLVTRTTDSISKARPMALSFKTEGADVDEFIPLGYNEEGSIAYFLVENMGGGSDVRFYIGPGFGLLTANVKFEMDLQIDSILKAHRNMLYYSLQSAHIKIADNFQKLSLDSFQQKYKFEISKTTSKPGVQEGIDDNTLASVAMKFDEGNGYMNTLIDKRFQPSEMIYDMNISDCFVIPGKENEYGFVVVVTESAGFEGTPRKTIEILGLGSLKK